MKKPIIIFITGLVGTGKTTLAAKIAPKLGIMLIGKDSIKELLFDNLGYSDREWSIKLSTATYALLDYITVEALKANQSIVLESNFDPEFSNKKYQDLQAQFGFHAIQIVCSTDKDVLIERFTKRAKSGERHKGHVDADNLDEWRNYFRLHKSESIDISGEIISVDTIDFNKVDVDEIVKNIKIIIDRQKG